MKPDHELGDEWCRTGSSLEDRLERVPPVPPRDRDLPRSAKKLRQARWHSAEISIFVVIFHSKHDFHSVVKHSVWVKKSKTSMKWDSISPRGHFSRENSVCCRPPHSFRFKESPGRWPIRNRFPSDERLVNRLFSVFGAEAAEPGTSAFPPSAAFFWRWRGISPSPAAWRLLRGFASGRAKRPWISIAGSSSGDAGKTS